MTISQRSVAINVAALLFLIAAGTANAQDSVNVTVPGNTLGGFGNPSIDNSEPFVAALAVNGPGTITVSYLNGLVTDCCPDFSAGPNGVSFDGGTTQTPLQESIGVAGGIDPHTDALIGEFVSRGRTLATGFSAVDGTKDKVRVGLLPADLFFIGTGRTFPVTEAGTLFLGINDSNGQSNGGAFTVLVTFTPAN